MKRKRKTKTKTPRLDDERGIQGTERGGSMTRGVVPLDVRTCQLAENMKKKKNDEVTGGRRSVRLEEKRVERSGWTVKDCLRSKVRED